MATLPQKVGEGLRRTKFIELRYQVQEKWRSRAVGTSRLARMVLLPTIVATRVLLQMAVLRAHSDGFRSVAGEARRNVRMQFADFLNTTETPKD